MSGKKHKQLRRLAKITGGTDQQEVFVTNTQKGQALIHPSCRRYYEKTYKKMYKTRDLDFRFRAIKDVKDSLAPDIKELARKANIDIDSV